MPSLFNVTGILIRCAGLFHPYGEPGPEFPVDSSFQGAQTGWGGGGWLVHWYGEPGFSCPVGTPLQGALARVGISSLLRAARITGGLDQGVMFVHCYREPRLGCPVGSQLWGARTRVPCWFGVQTRMVGQFTVTGSLDLAAWSIHPYGEPGPVCWFHSL